MKIKISQKFNTPNFLSINKNDLIKEIYLNKNNLDFNDFYNFIAKHCVNNNNYDLLFKNKDLFPNDFFLRSIKKYFENHQDKLVDFLEIFVLKMKENDKFCKKYIKTLLKITDYFLSLENFKTDYRIIDLFYNIYDLQKNKDGSIKDEFLLFYKKFYKLIEEKKTNFYIIDCELRLSDENPYNLFIQTQEIFNKLYDNAVITPDIKDEEDLKIHNINIHKKYKHSNFQDDNVSLFAKNFFKIQTKKYADKLSKCIRNKNDWQYSNRIFNGLCADIDKFYKDYLIPDNKINDELSLILKNYLFHANYSLFCLNLPTLSIIYIYLFLHALNIELTGKENNEIEKGIDFLLSKSKIKKAKDKEIFLSFLTKEHIGLDYRTGILHSVGYDLLTVEIFCFYFFSFFHNNFYIEKRDSFVINGFENNILGYWFNIKDLMSNVKITNLTQNPPEDYRMHLLKTNNQISLFILNIVELEYYLFHKTKNPFSYKNKNNFIHFAGFQTLKDRFKLTDTYKDNKVLFDDIFEHLYFYSNEINPNIRNYIFHESNKNVFDSELEKGIINFNDKFETIKQKGILK